MEAINQLHVSAPLNSEKEKSVTIPNFLRMGDIAVRLEAVA
jgi:hypothetical protein